MFEKIYAKFKGFCSDQSGVTVVEYAFLAGAMGAVLILGVSVVGDGMDHIFTQGLSSHLSVHTGVTFNI